MSASNTISIQLVLQGSPEVVNQIKSVLTGINQLKVGLDGAKQTMSGGFRLDSLQGLGNAIGSAEAQTNKFRSTLSKIGGEISKNGAAFSVAAASVWGVYNAYDSLTKVQIRASQSITRVSSLTTTLRTLEERLTEARNKGNLSAEEMAILEQRITDTKNKLAVAQERSADLQGDVNEAWGQFASQVGPQVVAAGGSIAQVVTSMRGSMAGIIPRIQQFFGGMSSLATSSAMAATSATPLSGIFNATGAGAQVGATGIRAMSAAMKGLLIGTGIGAVLVAIGLLTEGFGLLNDASAESASQLTDDFATMGEGPKTYQTMVQDHLDKASEIVQAHTEQIKKSTQEQTAAYVKGVEEQLIADRAIQEAMTNKTKMHLDAAKITLDQLKKEEEGMIKFGVVWQNQNKKIKEQSDLVNTLDSSYKIYSGTLGQLDTTLVSVGQRYTFLVEKENAIINNQNTLRDSLGQVVVEWDNTVDSMKLAVDATLQSQRANILATGSYEDAIGPLEAWAKLTFGQAGNLDLQGAAVSYVRDKVKELLPEEEKLQKAQEKSDKTMTDIIEKMKDLSAQYGVEVPVAIAASEEAIDAYGKALDRNKQKIDDFNNRTKFLEDISGAEKAFKIEFDVDKEARDFIKDLPKDVRKRMKLIIDTQSDLQGVKNVWEIIAPGVFSKSEFVGEGGVVEMRVNVRPEFNNPEDISDIADTMIESLEDQFGKNPKNPIISGLITDLENADTDAELKAAFGKIGINLESVVLEDAEAVGLAAGKKIATSMNTGYGDEVTKSPLFDALMNTEGGTGVTTFDKNGNPIHTPRTPKDGGTQGQIADQTALQVALQATQTALANLSNEGLKSLAALAKGSSIAMNGIKNNLSVAEVAAQKLQTGVANLSNEGIKSLAAIAKGSSIAMNGFRNNLTVGAVASQKLQTALANLAIQGSNSLRMLAEASSRNMNGFINNLKKGEQAVKSLQKAIDSLEDKTVTITTIHKTKEVKAQHGFHGVVSTPTNFTVGEGFKPELVSVTPLDNPNAANAQRDVIIEPFSQTETISRTRGRTARGGGGPTIIQLTSYIQAVPGSDAYRKVVQEFSLDDLSRFATA